MRLVQENQDLWFSGRIVDSPCGWCRSARTQGQRAALDRRRAQLIPLLEAQMEEPGAGVAEVRTAAALLAVAAGKARALKAMLDAHTARLSLAQQQLLKPQNSGAVISRSDNHFTKAIYYPMWTSWAQSPSALVQAHRQIISKAAKRA